MGNFKDMMRNGVTPTEKLLTGLEPPKEENQGDSIRLKRNPKMIQAKTARLTGMFPPTFKKQVLEYCKKNDISIGTLMRTALTVCIEEDWFGKNRFTEEELFELQNRE